MRHFVADPALDEIAIVIAEPAYIGEISIPGFGQPRGHEAGLRDGEDLRPPATRIGVGEQAERTGAARMMAGGAVVKEDRRNVATPGW